MIRTFTLQLLLAIAIFLLISTECEAQIAQPLRGQLEIGCHYMNADLTRSDRWLYCGCVIQRLEMLVVHWDQLPETIKHEILIHAVYVPCTAYKRERV